MSTPATSNPIVGSGEHTYEVIHDWGAGSQWGRPPGLPFPQPAPNEVSGQPKGFEPGFLRNRDKPELTLPKVGVTRDDVPNRKFLHDDEAGEVRK